MKKLLLYTTLFLNSLLFAQTKSNLEKINLLLNEVCGDIKANITDTVKLNFQAPANLYFLKNRTEIYLLESDIFLNDNSFDTLTFVIEEAGISYENITKTGFFGDYIVERYANIKGTYSLKKQGNIILAKDFNLTNKDSVDYEDINKLENYSLPFTRGNSPPEPITPSIIEPLIAISGAVLTVVLFFTVRSK